MNLFEQLEYLHWAKSWIEAYPLIFIHDTISFDVHDVGNRLHHEEVYTDDISNPAVMQQQLVRTSPWRQYLAYRAFQALFQYYDTRQGEKYVKGRISESGMDLKDTNLGYGEIHPESIIYAIAFIQEYHRNQFQSIFRGMKVVDLGSGNGKVLFSSLLIHPFQKVVGVEIMTNLHCEAIEYFVQTWENEYVQIKDTIQSLAKPTFQFLNEDFRCTDSSILSDADVVIVHGTMFNIELTEHVQRICYGCNVGSYFIMITKPLPLTCEMYGIKNRIIFETLLEIELPMSWGTAIVYIQRKCSS